MLSKFSVKKPYTVMVAIALVVVLGVVSLSKMTTDLLPNMNLPYAIVMTTYPGASPEEVEEGITKPIESAMLTTSNIKHVSSTSAENYSMVIMEFEQSANMDSVTIEMRESLDQISGSFPEKAEKPIIMKINPDMMPIIIAAVDVDGMDRTQISNYVEEELISELESIEGVASVSATGSIEEHIEVTLNQKKINKINKKITASLDKSFEEAEQKMEDAREELQTTREELENKEKELGENLGKTQSELIDKKVSLQLKESELQTQISELKEQKSSLEDGIEGLKELSEAAQQLESGIATAESMTAQMQEAAGINLTELKQQYAVLEEKAASIGKQMGMEDMNLKTLSASIQTMTSNLAKINAGIVQAEAGLSQIEDGKSQIDSALSQINSGQISGAVQMGSANAQLSSGEQKLEEEEAKFEETKEEAYESASLDSILTMDMLKNILTAQNFSMPAGYITEGDEEYLIRVGDKVTDVDSLSDLVLMDMKMDDVDVIRLSDVADIKVVNNEEEVYASVNGNPGVILSVEKQTGYSTGDVTDKVLEKLDKLEETEEGLHTSVLMDQGIYIDMVVSSVLQNMIVGGILAVLVLLLFLKDIRPTIVIACSIPVSVIVAVVFMYFTGITLNMISLSGLALGIGMLVDNSIVVIENIYRLRTEGEPIKRAAVEGAKQVAGAIVASTLTTICVFAPIIFTEGITRQLFVDMGLTIAYSLLASLIIALTFVPMMASGVLGKATEKKHPIFDKLIEWYGKMLRVLLRFKPLVFLFVIALLAVSAKGAMSNGTAFIPDMDSNQMTISITPPKGADLAEASELSEEVMERILEIEDVDTVGAMAGSGSMLSMGSSSGNAISMYVILKDEPQQTNQQIAAQIEELTKDLDGEIEVSASAMDMSAMLGSGISVQIKGKDLDKLQVLAKEVAEIVEQTEGTIDVSDGVQDTIPQLKITVDKEKAAAYDMTVAQVFQLVYGELQTSTLASTISTDVKEYEVYVSTSQAEELSIEDIKKLKFTYTNQEGKEKKISLKKIATFEETEGLTSINRDAQERYITVTAMIDEDHNVGLVASELEKKLKDYECPEGYSWEMTGEDETINEAMEQLMLMLLLAVIFVYLIMVAQFQSLVSPFIIMFTIPLAFTGGFLALFLTGMEVSVIAIIGFVMLAGIIVNNGIVMVDYTNQLRKGGMEKKDALVEAGKTRLRPILMTALTTIIAMLIMALGLDAGSQMMQPMAVVVVGGMIYGTLLTLVVVPCIYDLFHRNSSMEEDDW